MKYVEPIYEVTILSTSDIVATSPVASLEQIDGNKASISTSLKDVL
jgi:hypothetical protein